jgi:hypothetical protein
MKLRKEIKYYNKNKGEIYSICLRDENGRWQGKYISYNKDGSIFSKGFLKDDFWIGKYYYNEKYYFTSFINLGKDISEQEHRKELAMVRLGLLNPLPELSYFLKDYDKKGKIN